MVPLLLIRAEVKEFLCRTHLINASVESETRRAVASRESFGVTFISNDQTPEVLQAGKQPLDFPPSSVSLQPTSILSRISSVPAMRSNEFNSVEPQFCVEAVGVVGVVTDQVLRREYPSVAR